MKSHTRNVFTKKSIFRMFSVLLVAISMLTQATPALAATITVSNTSDSGAGSLRQAIATAAAGDTINFSSGLSGGTITLISPLVISTNNLTIDASLLPVPITLTGSFVNVFSVGGVTATLDSLKITNSQFSGAGGAISNAGALTVKNSTISGNTAVTAAGNGGGIYNSGFLTVTNSTISGNIANGSVGGGGIYNVGLLVVTNSTFVGNSTSVIGSGNGGGIYNAGNATVANSTFSGNIANGLGGGGGLYNTGGTISIFNSTLSGNSAASWGGGINLNSGTLNYSNTIVANSTLGLDCYKAGGTLGTNTQNLVKNNATGLFACGVPTYTSDPKLGALASNGGPTQTMALLAGSPAIDVGDAATCIGAPVSAIDQRGIVRPQGAVCDIGAYEAVVYTLDILKTGSTGAGTVTSSPAGIDCGATCAYVFNSSSSVTLTATPIAGSIFSGWTVTVGGLAVPGACPGTGTCQLTMDANKTVTAVFAVGAPLAISKTGTGTGTVTSSPAGIDCGATCQYAFALNTLVTLTATPAAGSTFTGWSGEGCSGTGLCQVSMNTFKLVAANFGGTSAGTFNLGVTKAGTGTGTVTSSPAGIACGATCSFAFNSGTVVTLTAAADAGSSFAGWSGAGCSGTSTCVVTMNAIQSVTATFNASSLTLTVTKTGTGTGTVTSSPAGINCGATCSSIFAAGTVVTLTAVPDAGITFSGWSGGGCSGTGTCVVTMSTAQSVVATFGTSTTFNLTVSKTGSGTVTSSPAGINCGSVCLFPFTINAVVTLTAVPDAGSNFSGWSGAGCSGISTCVITMSADQAVTAIFGVSGTTTFSDVPTTHPYYKYIQALWDNGYTAGCSVSPLKFCPDTILDRAQSAVFILRGQLGSGYIPPAGPWLTFLADNWTGLEWAQPWAEALYQNGLTTGCQASPLKYCPAVQLPRVEASVFGLKMKYGMNYIPPAATGTVFADMIDTTYWGAGWAEKAYLDGLLPSCGTQGGKPIFCPGDLVNRGLGAYLVVKAKGLPTP